MKSKYKRTPITFKQHHDTLIVNVVTKDLTMKCKQASSLIAMILMSNNGLNVAQKASLRNAMELIK